MNKKQLKIICWKHLHWTAEFMGSFIDETCCLLLLQAQRLCNLSLSEWSGGHWSVSVAWDRWPSVCVGSKHQSCAHAMQAVRLPGAVVGVGMFLLTMKLCPAVSVHPVSQTIFSIFFFF